MFTYFGLTKTILNAIGGNVALTYMPDDKNMILELTFSYSLEVSLDNS